MVQLPSQPGDLISLAEASRILGVSWWTARRMVTRGDVTGYQVGRRIKVSEAAVRASVHRVGGDPQ